MISEDLIRVKRIQSDMDPSELNAEIVTKLIQNHKPYLPRYEKLQKYYEGETAILERTKSDTSKPNNKVSSGYPSYIIDLMQGMFVGKPISYTGKDQDYLAVIQDVFSYNDEQDENSELAKMMGIKGRAYEIVYMDEDAMVRFNEVDADEMIVVYNTKISPEMIFAIRPYKVVDPVNDKETEKADVYTAEENIYYATGENGLAEVKREDHFFGQVPVIEYLNNAEGIGDFERVIPLIDAYDKANSDTANDFEEFTDAILVLGGMIGTTAADATKLKEDRIILTDGEKQSAYWLIKDINDTALENYKNRLNEDNHKFTKIPDMTDASFAGNSSGVALEHKLLALEQILSTKERKFKRALQKRVELISTILNIFDSGYNYMDVDISFTRNKPINVKEAVEIASMLRGFTSMSTALSELPMIDNVGLEQEKIAQEKEEYDLGNVDLDQEDDTTEDEVVEEVEIVEEVDSDEGSR